LAFSFFFHLFGEHAPSPVYPIVMRAASRRAARLDGAFSGDIRTSSQRLNRDMLYVRIQ
jgi:hypothetical protein